MFELAAFGQQPLPGDWFFWEKSAPTASDVVQEEDDLEADRAFALRRAKGG